MEAKTKVVNVKKEDYEAFLKKLMGEKRYNELFVKEEKKEDEE